MPAMQRYKVRPYAVNIHEVTTGSEGGVPGGAMGEVYGRAMGEVHGRAMGEVPGRAMSEVPGGAMCEVPPLFIYSTRIRKFNRRLF